MNQSYCNECQQLAAADKVERDGKIYLVKHCEECGDTETIISGNATRYNNKSSLDMGFSHKGCALNCTTCKHGSRVPSFAFVDVTNLCDMDCPICCDNVPSMGFQFNPPMEYFEKLFPRLAEMEPQPTVALFGGEPTARDDLFEVIKLSRSHGLTTRVVTNGLKMADKDYCDRLLQTRGSVLLSYDGKDPETYVKLRGTETAMAPKLQAIENISNSEFRRRGKVMIISCIATGINEEELPDLIDFYHSKREWLSTVHLMPLAHTWENRSLDFDPDRITTEDIEDTIEEAFPGDEVEFVPASFIAQFPLASRYFGKAAMPFLGAHPNCESVTLLLSNGEEYVPVSRYLRKSLTETGHDLMELEGRLAERERKGLSKLIGRIALLFFLARHIRLLPLLSGRGLGKLYHLLAMLVRMPFLGPAEASKGHVNVDGTLQLIILPFEDNYVLETERLERCPNLHVYLEPGTDVMRTVPVCAWRLYNHQVMKDISEHYAVREAEAGRGEPGASPAS